MLWRVLQSNNGLPDEAVVCFANTGKEEEATLRFVDRCSREWDVPITWLEYRTDEPFAVVDFETASRNGEPFEALIRKKNYLPNPVTRFCTVELKIRPMGRYLHSIGLVDKPSHGEQAAWIGIRADEPRRVAKIPDKSRVPLAMSNVSKADIFKFWASQSFDLELPNMGGVTMHGNCDLCFLKGGKQISSLIQEKPERAVWWAKMETLVKITGKSGQTAGVFRSDRPSYEQMKKFAKDQISLFEDETIACFCGD
jgi:3'-phosphoadenosine 5'-phosphosulfate sulfotransferase (PAPS reductase)/FAD synthetase